MNYTARACPGRHCTRRHKYQGRPLTMLHPNMNTLLDQSGKHRLDTVTDAWSPVSGHVPPFAPKHRWGF